MHMEQNFEDILSDTVVNVNDFSLNFNNIEIQEQNENDFSALEGVSKDVNSEKGKVTWEEGSEVIVKEPVEKRKVNKQNNKSQFNSQKNRSPQQQNKKQLNVAKHNCDLSTNQMDPESPYPNTKGEWPTSYSSTSVQPKIFSGPGEVVGDTNPWTNESIFDDLKFTILPITTGSERLEYCQQREKLIKLRSVPETSFIDGDSFARDQKARHREVTHETFVKSRLATLRKTPACIVLPRLSPLGDQEKESFSSKDSVSDLVVGEVRMDGAQMTSPRFDPYHSSECGPDCRRCYFLTQTQNPPHLTSKIMKVTKTVDDAAFSKSQRKKFGFGGSSGK